MSIATSEIINRITQAAIDVVHAEKAFRDARAEIRGMYETYFRAHGRPEGEFLPYSAEWAGVVRFTAAANTRRSKARNALRNAKGRLERAVSALERSV